VALLREKVTAYISPKDLPLWKGLHLVGRTKAKKKARSKRNCCGLDLPRPLKDRLESPKRLELRDMSPCQSSPFTLVFFFTLNCEATTPQQLYSKTTKVLCTNQWKELESYLPIFTKRRTIKLEPLSKITTFLYSWL
jgi:hypothetical protein